MSNLKLATKAAERTHDAEGLGKKIVNGNEGQEVQTRENVRKQTHLHF